MLIIQNRKLPISHKIPFRYIFDEIAFVMLSRKLALYSVLIGSICAISVAFVVYHFFGKSTQYNHKNTNNTVVDQINKSTTRTYISPDDNAKIEETFYSYNSTIEAEIPNTKMLNQAKEILEQGLAPNKGYNKYNRTVAIFSDYIAIFGIKGDRVFYCIKAPSLEHAIAFEERIDY